jgi:hypothetical protein
MVNYSWTCLACHATVEAGNNHCGSCGCPAESTVRQQKAHRAAHLAGTPLQPPTLRIPFINNVSAVEAFRAFVFVPVTLWSSIKFITDGSATFAFGRHATHMIEVTGPWSSFLGALSLLLCTVAMGTIVVDYCDKRKNEQMYARILRWSLHGWVVFFIASCVVGWKLEVIRWVRIN